MRGTSIYLVRRGDLRAVHPNSPRPRHRGNRAISPVRTAKRPGDRIALNRNFTVNMEEI
jgi:hypothetical protein